jgi:hypothetical protein
MANKAGEEIVSTYQKMVAQRKPLELYWRDAFDYSYPVRGETFTNTSGDGIQKAVSAKRKQSRIYDSTGTDAIRLLASSMISGLTPASSLWFQLTVPNVAEKSIPRDAKSWLQNSSETIFNMIHSSNYNSQAFEFFTDIGVGGMCGLFVDFDAENGGFIFEFWPLATLYCRETLNRSVIDSVYRRVQLTSIEAVNRFGLASLPQHVQKEFVDNPGCQKEHDYIHVIRPRMKAGKLSKGKLSKQLPWESTYIHMESKAVVKEGGFEEFPVVVPRWMKIPDTDYALGPFNDALPDVKTLNKVVEMVLTNGEMAIAGTFIAKDDGVFNPNTVKIGPRKIIVAADVDNIKPLTSGGNFNVAQVEIQRLQTQIKRVMMSDQLAPSERGNMTATEVQTRTQMIRMILAPVYGRLQAEFLDPLIRRCFGLALRAGVLGKAPESLNQFRGFVPTYHSPIAKAQKMEEVTAIDQFNQRVTQLAQINSAALDFYDVDAALKIHADLLGVPVDIVRDDKAVAQLRQTRADAAQQAAQIQTAQNLAPMATALNQQRGANG